MTTLNPDAALAVAQTRYTCKAYQAQQHIDQKTLMTLLEMLRLAPSSINIQPWHFIVASSEHSKNKIALTMTGENAHNAPKVQQASQVLILATKTTLDGKHLEQVMQAEWAAGRFADEAAMQSRLAMCSHYLTQFGRNPEQLLNWAENQTFIALGHLLLSAQLLGINATPIGGYDATLLDQTFDLTAQGLKSSMLVSLGYAAADDYNKHLPKARLANEQIFSFI